MKLRFIHGLTLLICFMANSNSVADENQWRQCGRQTTADVLLGDDANNMPNDGLAPDRARMDRGDKRVEANNVYYSEEERKAVATGNVILTDPDLVIQSEQVEYWVDSETAKANHIEYFYDPSHASGNADVVEKISEHVVTLDQATYSTCDPEDRDWELKSSHIKLDREKAVGTARNVSVKFKSMPIFYTPWINFPLDDQRKTGLLAPTIGNSSDSGFELRTPFYWNIAPNRDAIITPRILSKRGVQLQTGFRYLNETNTGQLNLEWLDDKNFDQQDRYLVSWDHDQRFGERVSADILYNNISDDEYFQDLGDNLGITSTQFVERRGLLRYRGKQWNGLMRLQQFQIIDDDFSNRQEPYKRLPQLAANGHYTNLPVGLTSNIKTETVWFDHDDKLDGNRSHLEATLSRPFITPGYFFTPAASLQTTHYRLSNTPEAQDDNPSRTVPTFSLDSGLIFEKDSQSGRFRHTLEPRLFYLYTPDRTQDDLPVFDTSEYKFSFSQLFRDDRFTNRDRVGDANQLTAALSTRLLNPSTGKEMLRASIGQIYYFRDLDVQLPNRQSTEENSSNIAGELSIDSNTGWKAITSLLWDPQEDEFNESNARFQYISPRNYVFNVGHRFRRQDFNQTDFSMVLPISPQWRAISRWNYDLRNSRTLEILGGLEYDTCCWKVRIAGRRFNQDEDEHYNNSIELQLTLKGLTSIGSPLSQYLERSIRGYEDRNTFYYD